MKGLDISKMKKVNADDSCTTFKHDDGHVLKIAHSGLSPKLRKELDKLPIHQAEGPVDEDGAAEGDTSQGASAPPPQQAPVNININPSPSQAPQAPQAAPVQPQTAPAPAPQQPQSGLAPEAQAPAPEPDRAPAEAEAPQPNSGAPGAPPISQQSSPSEGQPGFEDAEQKAKQDHAQEFANQVVAGAQDLASGHLTPKTYKQLFADQSTLGKIGTMFGILVSGAGGPEGPKAIMSLMDKEIDRDLDAQQKSKDNAINFLKINQGSIPLAQTLMMQTTYHDLSSQIDKMPEGRDKQEAMVALGTLSQGIAGKINNMKDAYVGQKALSTAFTGGGGSGGGLQDQIARYKLLGPEGQQRAQDLEQKSLDGEPSVAGQMSTRPIPQEKRDLITNSNLFLDKTKELQKFIKENRHKLGDASKWPDVWKVGQQKADEMMNFYASSMGANTEGRIENIDKQLKEYTKNPAAWYKGMTGSDAKLQEIYNSADMRKNLNLRSLGFHPKGSSSTKPSADGGKVRVKDKSGNMFMLPASNLQKAISRGYTEVK